MKERTAPPSAVRIPAYRRIGQRRLRDTRVLPLLPGWRAVHALIIEDEPLIAMSIEDVLTDWGFTSIAFATSIDFAVASAKRRCPDLITADVQLAPGCGIEPVGKICSSKVIPVIFITATAEDVQARRPGSIVVHKPFDEEGLRAALGQAMAQVH